MVIEKPKPSCKRTHPRSATLWPPTTISWCLSRANVGTLHWAVIERWFIPSIFSQQDRCQLKFLEQKTKLWMPCTGRYNLSGSCLSHILPKQFFPASSLGHLWFSGGRWVEVEVKFIEAFDGSAKLMCRAISSDWHVLKQFVGLKVVGWYDIA